MAGMMGKVKEIQSKMEEAQSKLADITAEGESGAGMVKVIVNGKKELQNVIIEPELINISEIEMLQDLIVAAVNKALENVEVKSKAELQNVTQGMMPNIPGMDFDSMFNK